MLVGVYQILGALLLVHVATSVILINDVDGQWSPWSIATTSSCSKSCGRGKRAETRSCSNPVPSGNGQYCLKEDQVTRSLFETRYSDCNNQSCYENTFTKWENCPPCTQKMVYRYRYCGTKICDGELYKREEKQCDTWIKDSCPDPCIEVNDKNLCPEFGKCNDISTNKKPDFECVCTQGRTMNDNKTSCVRPIPKPPTPRPIPTLPPEQKIVATAISKSASSVLIFFVTLTLIIFIVLRIYSPDRVIQMNMEISLLLAHVCLMLPVSITEYPMACRTVSILIHFFFMACYAFIMLESLHMYSLVAFVVKRNGLFSRAQYTMIGWTLAAVVVLVCISFEFEHYGGEYHCWMQMDKPLFYGNVVPVIIFSFITMTLIEAAGSADYKPMKGINGIQLFSAKISQRTNLIILPLVIAHWLIGMLSEYEQNLPLYGTFSVLNGVLGFLVFFFHCTNNSKVRKKIKECFRVLKRG